MQSQVLLDVWEQGQGLSPTRHALLLLAATEGGEEEPGALPLGERDARLLTLRAALFGPRAESLAHCPACGETAEIALDVRDLQAEPAASGPLEIERDGLRLRFRLPDSTDLLAVEGLLDPEEGGRRIAARCLLRAERDGGPVGFENLSEEDLAALEERMEEADPGAELRLGLGCPACGHAWNELFDPARFLRAELDREAGRLLDEIHWLARAYGWTEEEALKLSPRRRRAYLERIGA
jgi:hypothetical protein